MSEKDDAKLDEAIAESFPASDPPANTVETGIGGDDAPGGEPAIVDNAAKHRFEIGVDGQTAFLEYERTDDRFTIVHTEAPAALRGRNLGGRLVEPGGGCALAGG